MVENLLYAVASTALAGCRNKCLADLQPERTSQGHYPTASKDGVLQSQAAELNGESIKRSLEAELAGLKCDCARAASAEKAAAAAFELQLNIHRSEVSSQTGINLSRRSAVGPCLL